MGSFFIYSKKKDSALSEMINSISCHDEFHILPNNNKKYYMSHGLYEANLIDWCKELSSKEKNFLDIGCHSGTYSVCLSKYFNKVYAFEPQRDVFYALCGSVALSNIKNIECNRVALGSEDQVGKTILNIYNEDGGLSSLLNNFKSPMNVESVEVRLLDSYNIKNVGFIKMDVEGNETNVILGSLNTLKESNYPKILFESNNESNNAGQLLRTLGYNISTITHYPNMFLAHKD